MTSPSSFLSSVPPTFPRMEGGKGTLEGLASQSCILQSFTSFQGFATLLTLPSLTGQRGRHSIITKVHWPKHLCLLFREVIAGSKSALEMMPRESWCSRYLLGPNKPVGYQTLNHAHLSMVLINIVKNLRHPTAKTFLWLSWTRCFRISFVCLFVFLFYFLLKLILTSYILHKFE